MSVAARADAIGAGIVLTVAAATLRLLLSGEYLAYVRPGMGPFLGVTVTFLVVLGGWTLLTLTSPAMQLHRSRTCWLLLWPVLVVLVVAPGNLGAFSAQRTVAAPPPRGGSVNGFDPLPPGDPTGLPLEDYVDRSLYGGERTLEARRLTVLGFVSPGRPAGTWSVTRLQIRCCAADAVPVRVLAVGVAAPPTDQWVEVTGRFLPPTEAHVARLRVESVTPVAVPRHPYVYG